MQNRPNRAKEAFLELDMLVWHLQSLPDFKYMGKQNLIKIERKI